MKAEKARDLLAMIKVKEPNELVVNSWWGNFVKDYKDALQMAIEALEQKSCEDLINQRATTCRHGGHCEWVACDKCNHYEPDALNQQSCDAISRQVVLDIVNNPLNIRLDAIIKALPSVTPKENTGKWIDEADDIDAQFGRHEYKCSVCGRIANYYVGGNECWWDIYKPNFCPNCGAKMVESQGSEKKE